jgi:hypothetical protein
MCVEQLDRCALDDTWSSFGCSILGWSHSLYNVGWLHPLNGCIYWMFALMVQVATDLDMAEAVNSGHKVGEIMGCMFRQGRAGVMGSGHG